MTNPPNPSKPTSYTPGSDSKKSQALAWWRNLWKLAISLQSSQGTVGCCGSHLCPTWTLGFVQKGDPFVNGILIQCGIFFWTLKNAYAYIIIDLFSKLRTPELRNSLHQKPYDLLAFHGIIITTSKGEQSNNAKHFLVHHLSGAIAQIYPSTYTLAKETEYCNLLRTYGWFEGEITTICKNSSLNVRRPKPKEVFFYCRSSNEISWKHVGPHLMIRVFPVTSFPSKNPQEPTLMMLQSGLVGWSFGSRG